LPTNPVVARVRVRVRVRVSGPMDDLGSTTCNICHRHRNASQEPRPGGRKGAAQAPLPWVGERAQAPAAMAGAPLPRGGGGWRGGGWNPNPGIQAKQTWTQTTDGRQTGPGNAPPPQKHRKHKLYGETTPGIDHPNPPEKKGRTHFCFPGEKQAGGLVARRPTFSNSTHPDDAPTQHGRAGGRAHVRRADDGRAAGRGRQGGYRAGWRRGGSVHQSPGGVAA